MSGTQLRRPWAKDTKDSDDEDAEEVEEEEEGQPRKRKADPKTRGFRKRVKSLIDDAAELSGSDDSGDDEEEDESEEDAVDYERDGFVVDEEASETRRHELEDSDSDTGSDSVSAGSSHSSNPHRRRRVQRLRDVAALDEEDLALIEEAKHSTEELPESEPAVHAPSDQHQRQKTITATSEAELRKELFLDSDDDEPPAARRPPTKPSTHATFRSKPPTTFDEDGLDDFIDYQEDDDAYLDADQRREAVEKRRLLHLNELQQDSAIRRSAAGVTQAQLQEATDIFGDEYLDIMASRQRDDLDDDDDFWLDDQKRTRKSTVSERGVGIEYGLESSDEDIEYQQDLDDDDDEDHLSQDSDDDPTLSNLTSQQRIEAKKLAREKRRLDKQERRRLADVRKAERRKARLKKAFEPVQLMQHFCTDKDDLIRSKDEPERFFDWTTPFHGPQSKGQGFATALSDAISSEEIEEALWIMGRIPSIASEFFNAAHDLNSVKVEQDVSMDPMDISKNQKAILDSISYALRFMHREKLEPEFIRRYRADIVTSPAVRDHLYVVMDDDAEWDRFKVARNKVECSLQSMTSLLESDKIRGSEAEQLDQLRENTRKAQERYDKSIQQETHIRLELDQLAASDHSMDQDVEDDLFGNEDQEGHVQSIEEDDERTRLRKQKESLRAHLTTQETLSQVYAEQLEALNSSLKSLEDSQLASGHDSLHIERHSKKMSINMLLNYLDYQQYLSTITEYRHAIDIYGYLSLVMEGNEAIAKKSSTQQHDSNIMESALKNKRSRRFDRDFYRTCVSEGLRAVCYKFVLPPYRVGIMLEANDTKPNRLSWDLTLPGDDGIVDPKIWKAPVVEDADPALFASDLVGSGELILLSSSTNATEVDLGDHPELKDPLRGCRYVAATELAHEPRVRRYLRTIYRSKAVLTTVPTKKGLDLIDAFHEFYGIHLIRNKPIKDHFPMDPKESEKLPYEERKALEEEMRNKERDSCIQYLNILKAERNGFIQVFIHLPFDDQQDNREKQIQSKSALMKVLESIYLPPDGDTDDWNEERRKVLHLALSKFLLPHFEAELKRDLLEASVRKGVKAAGKNLLSMAKEGPFRPFNMLSTSRFIVPTGDLPVVGAVWSSDGKEASYLASVSERGKLIESIGIPGSTPLDDIGMNEKIIAFLMNNRPALVAVGTSVGLFARLAERKLRDMVTAATERWNNRSKQRQYEDDEDFEERMKLFQKKFSQSDDDTDSKWECTVELVDDNVAQLFGRSIRGKKEFHEEALNLKCAVGLARYAKDPLAELTYAFTVASDAGIFGTELLYLNVHPLQQILPKPLLLKEYSRALCIAVAEVGVDLNASCTYDHLHGLLTFVPGFGPRKAASLRQSLERLGGVVSSRRELLAKRLVGPVVYNNSVAFLRIRPIDALSTALLHPLDDTRLHPDVYHRNNWATKIAIDALDLSDSAGDSSADKEDLGITALRDIMIDSRKEVERQLSLRMSLWLADRTKWEKLFPDVSFDIASWDPRIDDVPKPDKNFFKDMDIKTKNEFIELLKELSWQDKVEELDLEQFAQLIEHNNRLGKWLSHINMIKWEFRLPFADFRKPMEPLDREKKFRLLTGETDLSLRPGKEVTAEVSRNLTPDVLQYGYIVHLEGGLQGFIRHVNTPDHVLQPGQLVTAVITEVKKDHFSLELSLKPEDLRKLPSSWERPASLPHFDECFDRVAAETFEQEMSIERDRRLTAMNVNLNRTKIGGDGKLGMDGSSNFLRTGRVTRRACDHPAFRNATNDEVDRELKGGGEATVGEALIRPSSKQADVLVIHWHIRLGIVKVIQVTEEDKDNDTSIGNVLRLTNEVYCSIDELLSRFILPMNERVQELVTHRKFLDLSEDIVDGKLKEMKKLTPSGIFYFFCWSKEYPDCASLRYIINTTRFHTLIIRPDGFKWCNRTFPSIDALSNEFKKNPRGTSASASASNRSLNSSLASSTKAVAYNSGPGSKQVSRWGAKNNNPAPPTDAVITSAYASMGVPVGSSNWPLMSMNSHGAMLPPTSHATAVPKPLPPLMPAQGYPLYPPSGAPPSGYPTFQ